MGYYENLQEEMEQYANSMKSYLPLEQLLKEAKRNGLSHNELVKALGDKANILSYVPKTLYHGSPEDLDIIGSNESTQKGSYVYATDNPVHALFFSIFRNSSIARGHINEYIDQNGEYKVKYEIDERVKGALDQIITNKDITIHVCNGEQFFKPQGEAYIGREWISKNGQSIIPTDKIHVNVKHFFENLEKQGLIEYDRYDKSKDWKTVIDMLGTNYSLGLGTEHGKNIEEYDKMYDEFIKTNFPEQFGFSKKFRRFAQEVMSTNYKIENPNMTTEEETNYKLRFIKNTANSFLLAKKDEHGKINWNVDMEKINDFIEPSLNNTNELKKTGNFITVNDPNINLPYMLYIPNEMASDSKLIVSCQTPENSKNNFEESLKELEDTNKLYTNNICKNLITELKYPMLIPIIPRFRGFPTTSLSSKVKDNDTSSLIEWIDEDPTHYTNLEKENIDKLKDIDKQVYQMIESGKKKIKELNSDCNIDEKVIMTGYSAGAHFANGFTSLHPDIVDMEICGGQAGLQIQPYNELNGEKLNYPVGFNNIGNDKLEQYQEVHHFFYMGESDKNDPAKMENGKAKHSNHFSDNEVVQINKLYNENNDNSLNPQIRFSKNQSIYDTMGIDATFKMYPGNHESVQVNADLTKDVTMWVKSKAATKDLIQEKPKVLVNKKIEQPNGFTDALLLALITGFVGGIITTIMINIII